MTQEIDCGMRCAASCNTLFKLNAVHFNTKSEEWAQKIGYHVAIDVSIDHMGLLNRKYDLLINLTQ